MTGAVLDWLPSGAFSNHAVGAALAPLLDAWSERWFARARATIERTALADELATPADTRAFTGSVASAFVGEIGRRNLLASALAVDIGGCACTTNDKALLDAFLVKIVDDLVARIDGAVVRPAALCAGPSFIADFAADGGHLITIALPAPSIVPLLKATLPQKLPASTLTPRGAALGPTCVTLEGVLGTAEMAVEELDHIGIGDVIVFDTALDSAVAVRLANGAEVGRGLLRWEDNRTSIWF